MATVSVRIEGLERLRSKLQPALYLPAVASLLRDAALFGEREARGLAPRDTAALARSIVGEVTGPLTARISSPLQYAIVMEEGRAAGARMPPSDALVGWMRRHGIPASMKFVIARAIKRRGIKGRFFLRGAAQKLEQQMPQFVEAALKRIGERWSA